jgi:NhaA family Na+:H+ antiporter
MVADPHGRRIRRVGRLLPPFGDEFVSVETTGSLVLGAATVAALVWANVAPEGYASFWHEVVTVGSGERGVSLTLTHWINDFLMALFFFVVGLEIKRELVRGELRDRRAAALPAAAALGGMVVPAMLFLALNLGDGIPRGWAIPMATDIAFAVAVLAALGARAPRPMKLFLLTLAIVDDLGAIVVIALFYSGGVEAAWLLGALAVVGVIVAMQRLRVVSPLAYVVPAVALWYCVLESGVHATIAGVALGLLTPARPLARGPADPPLIERLERTLHPWSSLVVVPLFALANAGVVLDGPALERAAGSTVTWGVVLGLVVGKPLGVVGATVLAHRFWPATIPTRQVVGVGLLAGIGFTVSLFVAELAYNGPVLEEAKIGILVASLTSAILGAAYLSRLDGKRVDRKRVDRKRDRPVSRRARP